MFSFVNRTVFDIPITWNRTRFEATRAKHRRARQLIENSVNVQFEKQLKNIHLQNLDIEKTITETNEHLLKHEKKIHIFDNLIEIASQSLPNYFDKRMENVRIIIQQHCNAIQKILHEENEYWKEIHSAIDQNLITSNDIHPCIQNIQIINEEQNISELLDDNSPILIENDLPSSMKQERLSVILPSIKSNRILPPINTTYIVKLEETTNTDMNESSSHIPSTKVEASPMYSQPNPPARLYFSPTFLQDKESESIRNILSPLDQNQTNLIKPKVIIHRVGQTFLLDQLKTDENTNILIQPKLTNDSIQNESNNYHQNSFPIPDPISKPQTHSAIKNESELIHITKNTKQTRKRKQSISEDNDTKSNTIALRKRKPVSIIETEEKKPKKKITKKRKNNKTNENEIPIREPSPLPIIDRSKHYSTRFSTRSHRLNNFTLSMIKTENDDENNQSKFHSRLRKKSVKQNSNQTKKPVKSTKNKKR